MIKPFVKYFGLNLYLAKNILKFPLPKICEDKGGKTAE